MSTVGKLAKSNVKASKSRSILIILTIVLTTCLLTSVGIICANWGIVNLETSKNMFGAQHVTFQKTTSEQNKQMANHIEIDTMQVVKTIGSLKDKESNTSFVLQYTKGLNNKFVSEVKVKDGNFPVKENEILLAEGYMTALGKAEPKIGDNVTIKYESRKDGIEKTRDFIVCGIAESLESNVKKGEFFGVISEKYLYQQEMDENSTFTTYVKFRNEKSLDEYSVQEIVDKITSDYNISPKDAKVNVDYLRSNKPDATIIMGGIAIALFIIVSSMIVIYSIFYISIINKVQEYGKIRAIGATKKQIKQLIRKEGMLLAAVAVPVGLILGYIIGTLAEDIAINNTGVKTGQYDILILIGSMIISFLTVYMSILKPMKIASKISPVEAMRYNGDSNSKTKTREGYLEMTVPRLVKANLKRNRERTIITLTSLCLSGILFIVAATVLKSINVAKMTEHGYDGSKIIIQLSNYDLESPENPEKELFNIQKNNPITYSLDWIKSIDGVKDVKVLESTLGKWKENEEWASFMIGSKADFNDDSKVIEGEINFDNETGVILDDPYIGEIYRTKVGDKITIEYDDNGTKKEKQFTVMAITEYVKGGTFILPESTYRSLFKNDTVDRAKIYIEENKYEKVKKQISSLVNNETFLDVLYYDVSYKQNEMSVKVTKLMAYSLVIIIGIIGFINLINTIITSIVARRKELGILQAIGLSNKQFAKMIIMEGVFYVVVTIAITLTLGNVLGYLAFLMMKNTGASYASYSYPIIETILLIILPLIAQVAISYIITKKINKDSLVDRIRYGE